MGISLLVTKLKCAILEIRLLHLDFMNDVTNRSLWYFWVQEHLNNTLTVQFNYKVENPCMGAKLDAPKNCKSFAISRFWSAFKLATMSRSPSSYLSITHIPASFRSTKIAPTVSSFKKVISGGYQHPTRIRSRLRAFEQVEYSAWFAKAHSIIGFGDSIKPSKILLLRLPQRLAAITQFFKIFIFFHYFWPTRLGWRRNLLSPTYKGGVGSGSTKG